MKSERSNNKNNLSASNKNIHKSLNNLSKIREKSFKLNSSYNNINKILNNKYINDINLQKETKDCSKRNFS